jgi:hypothetical protein
VNRPLVLPTTASWSPQTEERELFEGVRGAPGQAWLRRIHEVNNE